MLVSCPSIHQGYYCSNPSNIMSHRHANVYLWSAPVALLYQHEARHVSYVDCKLRLATQIVIITRAGSTYVWEDDGRGSGHAMRSLNSSNVGRHQSNSLTDRGRHVMRCRTGQQRRCHIQHNTACHTAPTNRAVEEIAL